MCLSRLGQIMYGVGMLIALALTLGGALTPGWREIKLNVTTANPNDQLGSANSLEDTIHVGIFGFLCTYPGEKNKNGAKTADQAKEFCKDWWENLNTWEKVVISLICLTITLEIVALIYNLVTFCCCCCRGHALKPLAPLAFLCFILLVIAITIYGVNNKNALDKNKSFKDFKDPENSVSYSFFLECAAAAVLFVNIVIGSISAFLGDRCL